jgi:hypothetical protein
MGRETGDLSGIWMARHNIPMDQGTPEIEELETLTSASPAARRWNQIIQGLQTRIRRREQLTAVEQAVKHARNAEEKARTRSTHQEPNEGPVRLRAQGCARS